MTCRKCREVYDGRLYRTCPFCGTPRPRPRPAFLKTSTILISRGARSDFYRSIEEVPAPLRSQLLATTNGANSATILIADRKGREEIAKAVRRLPVKPAVRPTPRRPAPAALRRAAVVLLVLLTALSLWVVLGWPVS